VTRNAALCKVCIDVTDKKNSSLVRASDGRLQQTEDGYSIHWPETSIVLGSIVHITLSAVDKFAIS
jgi:hypothetical protein